MKQAGEYTIKNGRITDLGKFEGEARYLPYFYAVYLDGCADDDGDVISVPVTADDRLVFPELKRRKRVRFVVEDNGFVTEV